MDLKINISTPHRHLGSLKEMGLIARKDPLEYSSPFPTPFEKLDNPSWTDVNKLLIKRGVDLTSPDPTQK